mgnify:CR=1 FL=1
MMKNKFQYQQKVAIVGYAMLGTPFRAWLFFAKSSTIKLNNNERN